MADLHENTPLRLTLDEVTRAGARIKVVGVGGGGSNAVTRMVQAGLSGVRMVPATSPGSCTPVGLPKPNRLKYL